jgi:hypothetical protein
MTPRPTDPLTADTAADLIRLSTTVLGRVDGLAKDMGRRFSETNASILVVDGRLEKIDGRIGAIEQARVTEAALAVQAKAFADAQGVKDQKAADEKLDAVASHTLTSLQVKGLAAAAVGGFAGLIDVLAHLAGWWH